MSVHSYGMIYDEAGITELLLIKGSCLYSVILGNLDKDTVSAVDAPSHNEVSTYGILSVSTFSYDYSSSRIGIGSQARFK